MVKVDGFSAIVSFIIIIIIIWCAYHYGKTGKLMGQ